MLFRNLTYLNNIEMEYTIEEKCNNVIITLDGDFDNPNYDNFSFEMDKIIESGKKFLILNIEGLEHISSIGIEMLLSSLKILRTVEGDVTLCCMNEKIKSILKESGVMSLFRIEDNLKFD